MNKITQTLLLFLFFGLNVSAQLANWSPGSNPAFTNFPVNNSGQINGLCRISQMKFHASNANKMYAVTGEGGFFTSNDAGTTWTVKAGTENLTGNCASLCIDYTNDQIIYLGSGDANYFSNGQGIYKSTDGGTTFTATTLTNCLVIEMLQDPNNSGTFVAATNKGIYKSTNNGSTWTATTSTAIQFCDLKRNAAVGSSILYSCTRENSARLFRSTDFGSTWTQITSGITTSLAFIQAGGRIGVTPADPNVVYFEAIGGGGIIHKSIDSGLTFTVTRGEGAGTAALPYLTFYDFDNNNGLAGQGNYNNAICIDAANPAKIYFQAHNTWLSNDSGATWTEITHWSTKVHTDMHQLQQSPFDSTKLYSCNDGGIWLSTDGGNNWTTKSDGLYAYEIYNNCGKSSHTDPNNITIGTQDNGRVYRNASGWFCIGGGDDTRQKEYDYLPNGGYYYEKTNASRKAANGGASSASGFPTSGNYWEYLAFNRTNTNLGFMWFTDNNLYRSTNLSAATPTWTSVFTFSAPVVAMHSSIADSNRLYVITNDAKILVSSNALSATPTFTTFTLPTASSSIASISAIANNANTVYISINNKVYVSINAGASWTNITYNLPSVNHRRILAEEYGGTQELVFIATNNAVYYKKAGQVTWTNYSTNLPGRRAPTDFSLYDDGTSQAKIRYYTYGRGVWETSFTNLRVLTADFVASTTVPCTAATVNFTDLSVGNVTTRNWSFPGGTPSTSTAINPSVVYNSSGVYDVILQVGDGTTTHTTTKTAYITTNANNLPLLESFEGVDNPPIGWKNKDNSSIGFAWVKTAAAGGFGLTASSMMYDNYSYNIPGEKDELEVKKLNLAGLTSASLSFDVAYQVYTGYSDTLSALISTDCGANFASIYSKSGATLSTAGSGTNNFVPTAAEWRRETISLNTYLGNPNVIVQFQNTNGYGNKLYLDNVTFSGTATIVASAGTNGTISPNGSTAVTVGNNQVYTITPNTCYQVADVLVDGVSQGAITSYTFNSVTTGHTISATFSLRTHTLTASAGSNGTISSSGATVVNCGTNKIYTITPNACYQIADVLVDGVTQGAIATYTFTNVTSNHTISATFSLRTYSISASAGANGTISPNGTTVVNCGSNQTYTITPNACYQIANVLVDGVSQGAIASYTFTNVTSNHTISATFSLRNYSINSSAGANGTISPNGTTVVNCGSNQTYTITPNACYQIANVLVDGISQGAIATYTFTNVTSNHTISATFSLRTYSINSSAGANGTISPNGATVVNCGSNQTYTITPNACYQIADVLVDGISQGAITSFTFTNVIINHTISATFSLRTYSITASAGANGTISPNGTTVVNCGTNQTYTITPSACYQIADVSVDGLSLGAISSYTFTNITVSHTIIATFSQTTYSITASAGSNGTITSNGTTVVNCGTNKIYTITPNACYQIADVIVDGVSQGAITSYTFTNVLANHTISATFLQLTYSITTITGANGTIAPNGATIVNCGTTTTYTITPDTCFQIADVIVDGVSQGVIPSYTFTNVTTNHTISATFVSTTITYYADRDGDGFGDLATPLLSCTGPPMFSNNLAVTDSTDCNDFAFSATNSCASIVNLKLFIEGFYIGNNLMTPVKLNRGVGSNPNEVDAIDVELRHATNYQIIASTTTNLATNGTAVCTFTTAPVGSFYIAVRYNNAIQTWSANPISVGASPISYDFTTSNSKAFGSNMIEVEPNVWAFYTGDINQDEVIDASDAVNLSNDVSNSIFGYVPTDLNGDGSVDNSDFPLFDNNSTNSIFSMHP